MLSRFRKNKKDDEGLDDALEGGEEEGLLMSTAGKEGAPAADADEAPASQAAVDELMNSASSGGAASDEDAGDDLLDAAAGEAGSKEPGASDDLLATASQSPAAEETPAADLESGGGGDGGSDDFLSAFRDTEVESDNSDLLKGIEDITMEEILTEAREVRALFGFTGTPSADEDEA